MPAEEVLSYYIRAYDLATPVFRTFGAEVEKATRGVQRSVGQMNVAMATQSAESAKLVTSQDKWVSSAHGAQREAAATGSAFSGMGSRAHGATTEIERHKNAIEQAGYGLAGFANQLGPLGRSLDLSARHAQLFRSQGIDYIAAGLVGAGASLIAFGTKANITFDNLSKQMQQQAGTSKRVTASLLADVKQVSTETPASYQAIASAVTAQYRLFHSSNQQIKENTDLFISFAEASGRQVQPAIASLSNIMRQFHPAGMSVVDVMDQMVHLSQKTQQPLSDYLNIVDRFGPVLHGMGLSFTQIIGLFKAFSDHGVSATMMSRGLFTAMGHAEAQIKAATKAQADGGASLIKYRDAVDSAQIRVNELNTKLATGKGNQKLLNDELLIANDHLTLAQQKYGAYTQAIHGAGLAHMTVASIITNEMKAIEGAATKSESLNLATKDFGSRLGPQMSDALWHNKAGLDAMDKALGNAKGSTQQLAKTSSDTLHGQMTILSHDFNLLASEVGISSTGLKGIVHDVDDVVKAIAGIPKPVLDFLVYGGMGVGAAALVARHTPLGGVAAKATGAGPALSTFLTGKSPTGAAIAGIGGAGSGALFGAYGNTAFVGTLRNPVAVMISTSQMPGASPTGPMSASEKGAAAQTEVAAAEARAGRAPAAVGQDAAMIKTAAPVAEDVGLLALLKGGASKALPALGMASLGLFAGVTAQSVAGLRGGTAGTLEGGAAGGAIGTILLGPGVGTAIGAAVGSALGPTIGHLFTAGPTAGQSVLSSQGAHFGSQTQRNQIAQAANDAQRIRTASTSQQSQLAHVFGLNTSASPYTSATSHPQGAFGAIPAPVPKLDPAQVRQLSRDYTVMGMATAKALETGWDQYKTQSPVAMFEQFKAQTKALSPQAKAAAAESVIAFSNTLVNQGKLSRRQADSFVAQVEGAFPALKQYMGKTAQDATTAFRINLNLDSTAKSLAAAVGKMRNDLPGIAKTFDSTKGDIGQKTGALIKYLQSVASSGSGPMAAQAKKDLQTLQNEFQKSFDKDASIVQTRMTQIVTAVAGGNQGALTSAQTLWHQFSDTIQKEEKDGVISVTQGNQKITAQFDAMAKNSGRSLKSIQAEAKVAATVIPQVLGKGSAAAEQALSSNFTIAAVNVQKLMKSGVISTQTGIDEINKLMTKALQALGAGIGKDITSVLNTNTLFGPTPSVGAGGGGGGGGGGGSNPTLGLYEGGKVHQPMYRVGEEAPAHPEYVLATNPAYRARNLGLWAQAGHELDVPGFRTGGVGGPTAAGTAPTSYVFPFPKSEGFTWERIDQGQDLLGPPGGPVLAIGPGNVSQRSDAFSGFGPYYPVLDLSAGPWAGRSVYYGHAKTTHPGAVGTGQVIGVTQTSANEWTAAPAGWLEFGFTTALGAGIHGQGAEVAPMLHALAAGHMVAGTGGPGAVWNNIAVPKWTGPGGTIGAAGKAVLRKVTDAANKYGQAKAAAMGGAGAFTGTLSGPVERQVYQFMSAEGFNKIAIAGMLGNAYQESSDNPNLAGGGMWQQISNFGSGTGGSLLHQMQVMTPQIAGIKGALNAASSPGDAAVIFEQGFERAGIPAMANRIAAANAAYAAGYAQGGVVGVPGLCEGGYCAGGVPGGGGTGTGKKPAHSGFPFPALTPGGALHQAQAAARQYWSGRLGREAITTAFGTPPGNVGFGGVPEPAGNATWGWTTFDTPRGPNNYHISPQDFTNAVVHLNASLWGTQRQQEADFPDFCGLMVHEYGHLAGHPDRRGDSPSSITYPVISARNRGVGPCVSRYGDFGAFHTGKVTPFAGAFGDGGMVTAHEPTTAVFGDKGAETAVFIPHHQTGGVAAAADVIHGLVQPGTYPTSPKSHTHKPHKPKSVHYTTSLNPLTGQVETHSTGDWQLIHAESAKEHHDAAAAKKAYDAWLAQQVTDMLKVGGVAAGDIQLTRKQANAAHLPLGRPFQLMGRDINALSDSGFKRVQSGLSHQLAIDTLGQSMHLAGAMNVGISRGADRGLFRHQGALEGELKKLNRHAEAAADQRDRLWKLSLTEHGRQRTHTLDKLGKEVAKLSHIHHEIGAKQHQLTAVGNKIADSRPAQLENQVITAAAKGIASAFSNQQAQFTASMTTLKLISGLSPGTNMHLSNLQRQAMGLTKHGISVLEGGGPGALGAQIHEISKKEIPAYQSDARRLQALYKDALKTHNKKLQDSLLKQLDDVTKATVQAYADLAQAQQDKVSAVVTKAQQKATGYQSAADITTAIQALASGSSTGLSAATLRTLGISPAAAAGGATSLATVAAKRTFTAADIMGQGGQDMAIVAPLAKEKSTDLAAIHQLTGMLPTLTDPAARQAALTQIATLSSSVVSLTDQITKATNVTQQEIDAINAQVAAGQAKAQSQQTGVDIMGQISNLAPGTNLSSLGITPGLLAAVGIDPAQAAAMEGGGSSYLSTLQTAQGGTLTPAQLATAQLATKTTNTGLAAEMGTDKGTLASLEAELPSLSGDAATTALTQIAQLITTILGLQATIDGNTTATAALTKATSANTTATGQMTGTVGYTYQGQNYVPGGDMTSDDPSVITLGT